MDGVIVDTSIAVAWCFPDEKGDYPQSVLDSLAKVGAVVPSLWPLEVANALLMGERRKRSTPEETLQSIHFLESLPIAVDDATGAQAFGHTLHLALRPQPFHLRCVLPRTGDEWRTSARNAR